MCFADFSMPARHCANLALMDAPQPHEPDSLTGRRVVLFFCLLLLVISIGSYLFFRFALDIPHA